MKIFSFVFLFLFHFPIACNEVLESLPLFPLTHEQLQLMGNRQLPDNMPRNANLVLKSTDGGQTWQDISEGLPGNFQRNNFFVDDIGLHVHVGNGLYHSKAKAEAPIWEKEMLPEELNFITSSKTGIYAYNYKGYFSKKINGTSVWSSVFTNFQEKEIRSVYETACGSVFIGSNRGLFKSTDNGKTWKLVYTGGWVIKMLEEKNVLLATSQDGIMRSSDGGENWNLVISEGGVGIEIEPIQGGFAAISYSTKTNSRMVYTSYDDGKSWQSIDPGFPASLSISSMIQVGADFLCGHPDGILKSSDQGKTWKMLLPSLADRVYHLSIAGNVVYAVLQDAGC